MNGNELRKYDGSPIDAPTTEPVVLLKDILRKDYPCIIDDPKRQSVKITDVVKPYLRAIIWDLLSVRDKVIGRTVIHDSTGSRALRDRGNSHSKLNSAQYELLQLWEKKAISSDFTQLEFVIMFILTSTDWGRKVERFPWDQDPSGYDISEWRDLNVNKANIMSILRRPAAAERRQEAVRQLQRRQDAIDAERAVALGAECGWKIDPQKWEAFEWFWETRARKRAREEAARARAAARAVPPSNPATNIQLTLPQAPITAASLCRRRT